jgi:hypothetical protein
MAYLQTITLLLFSFNSFSQQLRLEDGIYSEVPDYNDSTYHKYTIDNISYQLNKEFIYDYYYIDSNNIKFKFIPSENYFFDNPLNLIHIDSLQSNYIDKIKISVSDDSYFFTSYDSSYNQTVVNYDYMVNKTPSKEVFTGIIDNRMNLWIHPPRQYTFRILQLCPYPFYYLDENINHWEWNLYTNGLYLDTRWIKSTEGITISFDYKRMPQERIKTPFGFLQCKVTYATGTFKNENIISHTYLKSYYHPNYGFIKLEYDLINKEKIIINLIEMNKQ